VQDTGNILSRNEIVFYCRCVVAIDSSAECERTKTLCGDLKKCFKKFSSQKLKVIKIQTGDNESFPLFGNYSKKISPGNLVSLFPRPRSGRLLLMCQPSYRSPSKNILKTHPQIANFRSCVSAVPPIPQSFSAKIYVTYIANRFASGLISKRNAEMSKNAGGKGPR
jgi:hypothetical protein